MKQEIFNQRIEKQFGTLANACKVLDINYRTLCKLYNGKASKRVLEKIETRIKGRGFSPKTFKRLEPMW